MKNIVTIVFVLLFAWNSNSQSKETKTSNSGKKIVISRVRIVKNPLKEVSYYDALQKFTSGKIEAYPKSEKKSKLVTTKIHPVVGALHYGFAQHRPVSISPDMIWLMIMQGFAKHISYMSDSLRSEIVNFEGQQELSIRQDKFKRGKQTNKWNEVFPEFREQIKKGLNPELDSLMMMQFSTTGEKELIANQITMMSALNKYYKFSVESKCGIPYIILEGTSADWHKVYKNTKKLRKYNLEFWIDPLLPILRKIHKSSMGKKNRIFWKSMYKWSTSSGGDRVTGWIIKFFPYLEKEYAGIVKNRYLNTDYYLDSKAERAYIDGMSGSDFTSGMSVCNFKWNYHQTEIDMQFFGGFIGFKQDENFVLRPEINWFVAEKVDSLGTARREEDDLYGYSTEIDNIRPCKNRYTSLLYEKCDKPDTYPIYKPDKNDNYKDGWREFLNYVDTIKDNNISGKVNVVFYIEYSGKPSIVSMDTQSNELKEAVYNLFYEFNYDWETPKKDGKYVITEMKLEIKF